jgi:hypothetical protein
VGDGESVLHDATSPPPLRRPREPILAAERPFSVGRLRTGAGVIALLAAAVVTTGAGGVTGAATARASTIVSRSAHVSYEGCPAKDVELTVTLSARTYAVGQNVHYWVRLHNLSAKTCIDGAKFAPVDAARGPSSLDIGPCSSLPLSIENTRSEQVYPDAGGIACPMLLGPSLTPHATLRTTGTWDRVEGSFRPVHIPAPAPPGHYRLFVGHAAGVPFTLTDVLPAAALTARVEPASAGVASRAA